MVQRSETKLERERVLGARGAEATHEELCQALPATLRRVERVERTDGLLVQRIDLEDPLVVGDRLGPLVRDLFRDERDFGQELRATRGLGSRRDGALVHAFELGPLLARGEDLLQAMERSLVARIAREDALEVRPRAIDLAELLVVERRRSLGQIELDGLGQTGFAGGRHRRRDGLDEALRALRLVREDGQAVPQRELGRVLADCARDDVECESQVAELLLVHVGEPTIEREAILACGRRGHHDLEHLGLPDAVVRLVVRLLEDDRRVRARLAELQELLDHRQRRRIVGHELHRALGRRERVGRTLERAEIEPRELDFARRALGPFALVAILLDDLCSPLGVARRLEQTRERTQRAAMLRHQRQHPPIERDGSSGIAERLFLEHRPFAQEIELGGRVGALDAHVEEPAQIVSAIGRSQDAIERLDGDIVLVVLFDEPLVRRDRLVDAPELRRVDLRELPAEDALLLLLDLLALHSQVQRFDERRPLPARLGRLLEATERALCLGR